MKIKFNTGRYNPRIRIIALATAMALVFGLIAVRLVYFQIVHGEDLLATARENTSTTITVQAARGGYCGPVRPETGHQRLCL